MPAHHRISRAPVYLGETLVWTFADDDERKSYMQTRRRRDVTALGLGLIALACVVFIAISLRTGRLSFLVFGLLASFGSSASRYAIQRRYGLTSISLRLHVGWFSLTEHFGAPDWWRDIRLGQFRTKHVLSAQWVTEGCLLRMNRVHSPAKQVLVHRGFFSSEAALKSFLDWAQLHGVLIDGVPPLPGAYNRPIEERRGL